MGVGDSGQALKKTWTLFSPLPCPPLPPIQGHRMSAPSIFTDVCEDPSFYSYFINIFFLRSKEINTHYRKCRQNGEMKSNREKSYPHTYPFFCLSISLRLMQINQRLSWNKCCPPTKSCSFMSDSPQFQCVRWSLWPCGSHTSALQSVTWKRFGMEALCPGTKDRPYVLPFTTLPTYKKILFFPHQIEPPDELS